MASGATATFFGPMMSLQSTDPAVSAEPGHVARARGKSQQEDLMNNKGCRATVRCYIDVDGG